MTVNTVYAQQAGQVIFIEDFGTGVFPDGEPLPAGVTNFEFFEPPQPANFNNTQPNNGIVDDGLYTIGNNTQQAFSSWADIEDATPGDVNGFMLIVNARENPTVNGEVVEDEFFRQTVSLTSNTSFDFLASLVPTNSVGDEEFCRTQFGALILPNVRFSIQQLDGTVLAETVTGEIPFSPNPQFEQFDLTFSTAATVSDVQVVLSNIAPGGCGNDIAIDDIIFRISITANALDDSEEIEDASISISDVLNVVGNDTLDGNPFLTPDAPGSNTVLTLASGAVLPPELTFDTATGDVGVVGGTPNGTFTFDYQICETAAQVNCDIGTVTIIVNMPAPPLPVGAGACPAGQIASSEVGFAVDAIASNANNGNGPVGGNSILELVGSILPDGTFTPNQVDPNDGVFVTFFPSIDLDFTGEDGVVIPGNSIVTLVLGPFFNNAAQGRIEASADGVNFVPVPLVSGPPGDISFGNAAGPPFNVSNTVVHFDIVVPGEGARYIRLNQLNGGFRVGGGRRTEICQPEPVLGPQLEGLKTVELLDGEGFAVPGADVLYTISVSNIGETSVDEDTIFLIDELPPETIFINDSFTDGAGTVSPFPVEFVQVGGAALDFDFNRDVGFALAGARPADFASCSSPASLVAGANPDIRFICFNPKGSLATGNPDPMIAFRFRVRIR